MISVGARTPILVCFHKPEITPPSNFNHSRDGTTQPGDTAFITKGTVGRAGYLRSDQEPVVFAPQVAYWRSLDHRAIAPRFIFYLIRSPAFAAALDADKSHGAMVADYVSISQQHDFVFLFPPRREQDAIAFILGALDDKIDLNRRMNETLEAMARAIFKDWFVDFGPTRAKMEERAPYLAPEVWSVMPKKLDPRGKPEGWVDKPLAELSAKIGSGATPAGGSRVYVTSGPALIRSQNIYDNEFLWDGLVRVTDDAATKLKGVTVLEGDVLINITGDSILRCCVVDPAVLPARVNQHVSIVRAKPKISSRFLQQYLVMRQTKEVLLGYDAGASRAAITKAHLERLPVLFPGVAALAAYDSFTAPFFQRVEANISETRTLAATRDLLLPKLMSGEIRVRDAEKVAEAVV